MKLILKVCRYIFILSFQWISHTGIYYYLLIWLPNSEICTKQEQDTLIFGGILHFLTIFTGEIADPLRTRSYFHGDIYWGPFQIIMIISLDPFVNFFYESDEKVLCFNWSIAVPTINKSDFMISFSDVCFD